MTSRTQAEQAIAQDLDLIALVEVLGTPKAKRKAAAHRKIIRAQLVQWSKEDGLADMSADDIYAELCA